MKVVHIIEHLNIGGEENLLVSLIAAIQRQLPGNCRQTLLVLKGGDQILQRAVSLGIQTIDCSDTPKSRLLFRVRDELKRLAPDIVHTRLSSAGYWGRIAALTLPSSPVLIHAHGGETFRDSSLKRTLFEKILKPYTAAHVCVSDSVQAHLREHGFSDDSLQVITNGIENKNIQQRQPNTSHKANCVCLGRLEFIKGQDVLLDAMHHLKKTNKSVSLKIVGTGSREKSLQNQVQQLGLQDTVSFLGAIDTFSSQLHLYDAVILPSRSEGLSLTLLEAMASAVPVIATDVGENRTVLQGHGILVSPENPAALAEGISKYMQAQSVYVQDAQLTPEIVHKHYSIDATAGQYITLFNSLLSKSASAKPVQSGHIHSRRSQ